MLRDLCIDQVVLSNVLYEARTRPALPGANAARGEISAKRSERRRRGDGRGGTDVGASASSSAEPSHARANVLAGAAVEAWTQHIHEITAEERFANAVGMRKTSLIELGNEIVAGARRLKLGDVISQRMASIFGAVDEGADKQTSKATVVADFLLNGFVTELRLRGGQEISRAGTMLSSRLPETASRFATDYVDVWV
jgi:hypothetical protein